MSKSDKLIERFKTLPKDFTFEEMVKLLSIFGYELENKGRTSGSRVEFHHEVHQGWQELRGSDLQEQKSPYLQK